MFANNLTSVTYDNFFKYISDNKLTMKVDGMHAQYYNEEGKLCAQRIHGIASDMYFIEGGENIATTNLITKIMNNEQ